MLRPLRTQVFWADQLDHLIEELELGNFLVKWIPTAFNSRLKYCKGLQCFLLLWALHSMPQQSCSQDRSLRRHIDCVTELLDHIYMVCIDAVGRVGSFKEQSLTEVYISC